MRSETGLKSTASTAPECVRELAAWIDSRREPVKNLWLAMAGRFWIDRQAIMDRSLPLFGTTLPGSPGIYFGIGRDGELLYVGKSVSIGERIRLHGPRWPIISWVLVPRHFLDYAEAFYAAVLHPRENVASFCCEHTVNETAKALGVTLAPAPIRVPTQQERDYIDAIADKLG
jgi:hypothetical protein